MVKTSGAWRFFAEFLVFYVCNPYFLYVATIVNSFTVQQQTAGFFFRILQEALCALAEEESNSKAEIVEYKATYKVINPKSITMNQLYGLFDPYTHEWSDGVLGGTFREMSTSTTEERKWIVFGKKSSGVQK